MMSASARYILANSLTSLVTVLYCNSCMQYCMLCTGSHSPKLIKAPQVNIEINNCSDSIGFNDGPGLASMRSISSLVVSAAGTVGVLLVGKVGQFVS